MSQIKPKLLLISDLWGTEKSDWITYYTSILENHFDLKYYDSCDLGTVDKSDYSEENLHHQFVNGGIEKAAEQLIKKENGLVSVLGFSVGGLIAWKAGLSGLKIQNLYAISSTRLRYETEKPFAKIELFYGKNDNYKPDSNWFKKLELKEHCFENEEHELYTNKEIAESICRIIVEQSNKNKE